MLTSDSMSLLWLTYLGLSLVVLVAGYLAVAFLPRMLRLPITWAVAGILWMPTRFRLPLIEEGEFYTGMAPAAVVAVVAVLESNASVLLSSALLVAAGALLGTAIGILQAWLLRRREASEEGVQGSNRNSQQGGKQDKNRRRDGHGGGQSPAPRKRREPKVG